MLESPPKRNSRFIRGRSLSPPPTLSKEEAELKRERPLRETLNSNFNVAVKVNIAVSLFWHVRTHIEEP